MTKDERLARLLEIPPESSVLSHQSFVLRHQSRTTWSRRPTLYPVKLRAATWLVVATALAVLTPLYVAWAAPMEAIYHRSGMVLLLQATPYAVCALLWLPASSPGAMKVFLRLSIVLFVAACALNAPWLLHPGPAGDMVGLGYILICIVMTTAIVAISIIAYAALWWSGRHRAD